jgi:hypothetical protein
MIAIPRRLRRRRKELSPAAGMRVTDENVNLLPNHSERGTQCPE